MGEVEDRIVIQDLFTRYARRLDRTRAPGQRPPERAVETSGPRP